MRKIYSCIDIGTDTIRILVSEYYQGKLRTLAASSVKTKGVTAGIVTDEALLTERIKLAIKDINSRIDTDIRKVLLVIPSLDSEFNLVHGNIPIVNQEKMVTEKDILRVQNSVTNDIMPNMELVNITPIDFTIYENGSEIETIKNPKNKICDRLAMRAMIVTVPKRNLIPYVKVVEASGLEVIDLLLAPVCDYEEVKEEEFEDKTVGVINIGKQTTTVSIFNKGIITNSSVLKMGSKVIDDDISYIYYTNKKTAKKIKENFGVASNKYANKNETYEAKDINDKIVSINQYEVSSIINKRLVELLNVAKNELKVLTNKKISYIMVLGGIVDLPAMNFVVEDMFKEKGKIYTMNTLGIRKARFITASGSIKSFIKKINLRGKEYTMFSSDDIDNLVHSKTKIGKNESILGKFIGYFFDN